jgi:hypothetical protein
MLKFITDKQKITQAEISASLRASIHAVVDAEFNRVDFLLEDKNLHRAYGTVLTRDAKTGQYKLHYEEHDGTKWIVKDLPPANSLEALSLEMRDGKNKADFTQLSIDQVRAQAALIPAVAYARNSGLQALETIEQTIVTFYTTPNKSNYDALINIHKTYGRLDSPEALMARASFDRALGSLNPVLAKKLYGW